MILEQIHMQLIHNQVLILLKICTDVTFHGIYSFPRDSFIVNISMHFRATLDMTCSGSQGDLVSPVRGARDAPPMKSVSYHAVCAVISMS